MGSERERVPSGRKSKVVIENIKGWDCGGSERRIKECGKASGGT